MNKIKFAVFVLSVALVWGCKKDTQQSAILTIDPKVQYTADTFNDLYLWYESMPTVDLASISTPDDYIAKIRYSQDRWSFTMPYTDMMKLLQNGETTGWGFGFGYDNLKNLRIFFVYDNSAMGRAGVKRGWVMKSINGSLVTSMTSTDFNTVLSNATNTYVFIKNDGTETSIQMSKGVIGINSVLYSNVFVRGAKKIGYFVFNDFLGSSVKELNTTFDKFVSQGVTDLILDMRYNGGGTLDCADSLVALLAGKPNKDKVYNTLTYNNKHTRMGYSYKIGLKYNSIQLDKVVIITTSGTASASELVISGLKPYLNIKLIGSQTHGKPVGMNIEGNISLNLAVAPISFRNTNSVGYTDYFAGIPVDFAVSDSPTKDWGDLTDECLKAAVNYISTGAIGFVPQKSSGFRNQIIYNGSDYPIENLYQFGTDSNHQNE